MKILFFFGTRPEAIKMAPLIIKLKEETEKFQVKVCVSAQHREMLDNVLRFFDITPDYDLDIMSVNQDICDITTKILNRIKNILKDFNPQWLIVQGDTTTTFAGALAAFYSGIKVAHVEAGLRSFNKGAPFPEEVNRVLTTHLTDIHFAPTPIAKENLLREGVSEGLIHVVGNTGIDALFLCLRKITEKRLDFLESFRMVDFSKKILLVTGHRRESFGRPFQEICEALKFIAENNDVEIVYPVHLNPNVRRPVLETLSGLSNIHLFEPLDYPSFIWLMDRSYIILTDSGGIQEEAPSLGKPVLVMRDVTERIEGILARTSRIVGTKKENIISEVTKLLTDRAEYESMAKAINPYGDGTANQKICKVMQSLSF